MVQHPTQCSRSSIRAGEGAEVWAVVTHPGGKGSAATVKGCHFGSKVTERLTVPRKFVKGSGKLEGIGTRILFAQFKMSMCDTTDIPRYSFKILQGLVKTLHSRSTQGPWFAHSLRQRTFAVLTATTSTIGPKWQLAVEL